MKHIMITFYCVLFCGTTTLGKQKSNLNIVVKPYFGEQQLHFDTNYINESGDTLSINLVKFYLSNIVLHSGKGKNAPPILPHWLFDADQASTMQRCIKVNNADYDSLSIIIGVDSIANVSGANEGDLDPARGMYWAWNSGYIMAKLEGHSSRCRTLHHAFEFHIGGYKVPFNTDRKMSFRFASPLKLNGNKDYTIVLKADVSVWFSGKLDIAKTNSILIPGKEATEMADRYKNMLSILSIEQ